MMTLDPPRGLPEGADPWRFLGLSHAGLARFTRAAQKAVGLSGNVDILLTGDRAIRRLNHTFRGKDKATDVLSFPAPALPGTSLSGLMARHAGDLAVSVETAARQAREHSHSLRDEIRILLLHGLLHLHGMDHEADGGQMGRREGELRTRLRLPAGLIARADRDESHRPKVIPPHRPQGQASRSRKPSSAHKPVARSSGQTRARSAERSA